MFPYQSIVVAGGLLVLLFVSPTTAAAQSPTETRIALLQELVLVLQAQLELLQTQTASDAVSQAGDVVVREQDYPIEAPVFSDEQSFLNGIDGTVVARYRVSDMQIESNSRTHTRFITRVAEVIPDTYEPLLQELLVFSAPDSRVDAFVETLIPYDGQWRYAVDEDIFQDAITAEVNTELIVHEFAHIFSLDEAYSVPAPSQCHDYFSEARCIGSDTLYGEFLATFWSDELLDEAVEIQSARNQRTAIQKFYNRYDDQFVSRYAATNPAEDFAESFTYFVLYEDDGVGRIAEEKIRFFDRFSYPRELKAEILEAI